MGEPSYGVVLLENNTKKGTDLSVTPLYLYSKKRLLSRNRIIDTLLLLYWRKTNVQHRL